MATVCKGCLLGINVCTIHLTLVLPYIVATPYTYTIHYYCIKIVLVNKTTRPEFRSKILQFYVLQIVWPGKCYHCCFNGNTLMKITTGTHIPYSIHSGVETIPALVTCT